MRMEYRHHDIEVNEICFLKNGQVVNKFDVSSNRYASYLYRPKIKENCFLKDKKIDISKNIKYHFIKGTVFDRRYFARLFKNFQQVNKPSNADIILCDNNSIQNIFLLKNIPAYSNTAFTDKILYVCNDVKSDIFINNLMKKVTHFIMSTLYKDINIFDLQKDLSPYKGKIISVNDFLDNNDSNIKESSITVDEVLNIIDQINSKDVKTKKLGMEALLNYSESLNVIKALVMTLAKCSTYSNKFNVLRNRLSKYLVYDDKNIYKLFVYFMELCEELNCSRDCEKLIIDIFNNKKIQSNFLDIDQKLKYSINISLEKVYQNDSISEFIV